VGTVPDSLIREFKTKNGRKVYDGGGVNPDVSLQPLEYAPITRSLVENNIIFDFATRYRNKHEKLENIKSFQVDDALFLEFVDFASTREYTYETESEQQLRKLKEIAEKENYFSSFESEFNQLKEKMMHDKNHDIEKARKEISRLLGAEIASRYQYQRGRIEQSFSSDPEIQRAIEILNNKSFYQDVLSGKYVEEIKKKGK
jgi:carboxyl-terminal processing protease